MTIDEIFAALPDEVAQDVNEYLVIDPASRTIKVPESESIFGTEADADSERKYFICPRYVGDNLDLAACFLSIVYRNANGETDQYLITDTAVNGEYVTFSWLLAEKVVKYKGPVQFRFDADTAAGPAWGTTMAQGESLEGLEPEIDASTVEEQTSDVVTQLRAMVTQQTGNVEAVGEAQVAAVKAQGTVSTQAAVATIQAQGEATNASIPAEYTALTAQVDKLTRDRAAAIVCQAEGTAIQVQDASNDPLQGLRIFGRSTQDGTPSPDNPVEIVSTPAPVVRVCRKNLFRLHGIGQSVTVNGLTCTIDDAGIITLDGTPTTITWLEIMYAFKSGTNPQSSNIVALDSAERYILSRVDMGGTASATVSLTVQTDTIEMYLNGPGDWGFQCGGLRRAWLTIQANVACDNYKMALQIEKGTTATAYEPYTGQTLAITTPTGLPGIPVTSGGNYTDENGQQWIADEVDLTRGVYVQRVGEIVIDGETAYFGEASGYFNLYPRNMQSLCDDTAYGAPFLVDAWDGAIMGYNATYGFAFIGPSYNNTGFASADDINAYCKEKPATLLYPLANPIETALTDAELQAYLALHSNKPTTTVLNDAGAHMVLEYAADPKTFITNQIAAAIAAK